MVSAGLLLLLLMSSSLVLSSPSTRLSTNQQDSRSLQKRGEKMKRFLTAVEYADKIAKALSPFIGLIPVVGSDINLVLSTLGIITAITGEIKKDETMAFLKVEFQNLHAKIDRYHTQDKWNRLTDIYQKYETNIKVAWDNFKGLETSVKGQRGDTFKNFKENFGDKCLQSTEKLHYSLTSKQPSFNNDFKKSLIDFSRCHEKIIKGFSIVIAELFYAGITISQFIYKSQRLNHREKLAKMAHDSGSVMFEIHKHCIIDTDKHIKQDVMDLIDGTKDRDQQAKDVRVFLDTEFDRYNWMVVAFLTESSSHDKIKCLNSHTLSDAFMQVTKGAVTVAVAKQLKGTYSKAGAVREAIKRCFGSEKPECEDVIKKLKKCEETVGDYSLQDTYTAVHAFIRNCHESVAAVDAKEAPDEDTDLANQQSVPYVYTGKCKKLKVLPGGRFRVLIKSDEEMTKKPPCDKLHCGENGKCVVLGNTLIPVCECDEGFYGENCEESIDNYKKYMFNEINS